MLTSNSKPRGYRFHKLILAVRDKCVSSGTKRRKYKTEIERFEYDVHLQYIDHEQSLFFFVRRSVEKTSRTPAHGNLGKEKQGCHAPVFVIYMYAVFSTARQTQEEK